MLELLTDRGRKSFVDLTFFDVPETVAAVRQMRNLKAEFATVHGTAHAALTDPSAILRVRLSGARPKTRSASFPERHTDTL
ncbi:MAG: hypothetical protein MN733_39705, partial [Nitrososphaera sp.]|nr:hypothetical protein [Nitrososphaera sp.]